MMKIVFGILPAALLFFSGASRAADGFESIHCGTDIRQALVGRTLSNERVVAIEGRHKDLGLRDLGASEISDDLNLISWQICGDEYALLERKDVVRDVLKFPQHSKESPEFIGACRIDGHEASDTVVAVLKNEGSTESLSATAAWKIDEKGAKFVKLGTEGLRCPRDGVITTDGGS
jgi:hypothetical protein